MLSIAQQPVNTSVPAGTNAVLTCKAEGDNPTRQWFYLLKNGGKVAIGGNTAETLTLVTSPPREDCPLPFEYYTKFFCRVGSGNEVVFSEAVSVTVT